MGRLKPIITLFDRGWSYILNLSFKLILLLVIWSYNCNNVVKKKITHLGILIGQICWSTLNIFPQWISKPRIRKPKYHRKSSSGAGRFAQNLRACKKSQYDVRNCKSGRHNQRQIFKCHRSRYKPISTNIPCNGLIVKGRKRGNTKHSSPCRQSRMLCSLNHCQDNTARENTNLKSSLLPFEELIMDNADLSMKSEYDNCSNINLPLHHALNQVNLNNDLLDKVILTEVVLRHTKKPRSVGLHKWISKKNGNRRKSRLGNKKFRSVCKPLYWMTTDSNINNSLKSPRHLLYKSKDRNKYQLRNTSTLFPISWKFTKEQLRIIRDISIPDCLPYYGFNHRFELKTDLPSIPDKDKWLLYSLIERLLFISEITVPDLHACVSYIITRMESPSICHKNGHLQVDVLSVKKLRLFILSSTEEHYVHLESLFLKHTTYLLKICQHIIQSQRFKKASITLKRVLKNVTKRFDNDPYFILTKHKWINQGVKTINGEGLNPRFYLH